MPFAEGEKWKTENRAWNPRCILLDHFISGPNIALKIFFSPFHFSRALSTFVASSVFNGLDLHLDFIWPLSKLPLPFIERDCHCHSSRESPSVVHGERLPLLIVERDCHCHYLLPNFFFEFLPMYIWLNKV